MPTALGKARKEYVNVQIVQYCVNKESVLKKSNNAMLWEETVSGSKEEASFLHVEIAKI